MRRNKGSSSVETRRMSCMQSARRRDIEWRLTADEANALIEADCHYCGKESRALTAARGKGHHASPVGLNGIDRVDSGAGYTIENVVSCCKQCNFAKHSLTMPEFLEWLRRVSSRLL